MSSEKRWMTPNPLDKDVPPFSSNWKPWACKPHRQCMIQSSFSTSMGSRPRSSATTRSTCSKSRRSCKKSATRPLSQALARGQIAKTISGTLQLGWLERGQLAARLAQHRIAILCQLIQVVQQVHVEELRGQLLGEARLHPEIELPVTQLEDTMALVVIDHGAVIELGRA